MWGRGYRLGVFGPFVGMRGEERGWSCGDVFLEGTLVWCHGRAPGHRHRLHRTVEVRDLQEELQAQQKELHQREQMVAHRDQELAEAERREEEGSRKPGRGSS